MKFGFALAAMLLPTVAFAQTANPAQLQGVIDHGTALINNTVAQWGAQIIADQQQIEALNQKNAALEKKLADHEKKPEPPAGGPQLGTGK